jgi:hypothetical protein
MQRSDAIAGVALVVAVFAFIFRPAAPPSETPPPPMTHLGNLYLEPQGEGACKLARKDPDPIEVYEGDWVFWTVHNNCDMPAQLDFFDPQPHANNRSKEANPLAAVLGGPIPPKSNTGSVGWKVKTENELKPSSGTSKDKWTFKWKLNNATQQDPEIEIEYRRH